MKKILILLFLLSSNLYAEIIECNYQWVGSHDRIHANENFDTTFMSGRLLYKRNNELDLINFTFFRSEDDVVYLKDIKFLDDNYFSLGEILNVADHNVITKILLHMWISRNNRNAEELDNIINKLYDKDFTFSDFKNLVKLNYQEYFSANFINENLYEYVFNEIKKLPKENAKERLKKHIDISESELMYRDSSIRMLKFVLEKLNNFVNTNEDILVFDQKTKSIPQTPDSEGFLEYFTYIKSIGIIENVNNEFELERTDDQAKVAVVFNQYNGVLQSNIFVEVSVDWSDQQTWINRMELVGECT